MKLNLIREILITQFLLIIVYKMIVNFQYEIQHILRSLILMIFKWFENSLDIIKIHN